MITEYRDSIHEWTNVSFSKDQWKRTGYVKWTVNKRKIFFNTGA